MSAGSEGPGGRRWLRFAQPLVGVVVLAIVAWFLPWRDQLLLPADDGPDAEKVVVEGAVEGDWKGRAVRFTPAADAAPAPLPWGDLAGPYELAWSEPAGEDEPGTWRSEGRKVELRPSMPRVFRSVEPAGLAWGVVGFFSAMLCAITRWWRLLLLAGCRVSWWDSFRLSYLGLFFNWVVPGLTGGDVVKALLAVRENPGKRADALVSVVVDRLFGLGSLAALALVMLIVLGGPFAKLVLPVGLVVGAMVAGGLLYVNPPLRRLVRFDALIARLPMGDKLKSLDDAVLLYSRHPAEVGVALLLSLGNHFFAISGVFAIGLAFGVTAEQVSYAQYVAIVPVANMISSIPVAPAGWGLGEAAYGMLFALVGSSASLGVAVSVTFRLCQGLLGLAGGLFLLRPAARAAVHDAEVDAGLVEDAPAADGGPTAP